MRRKRDNNSSFELFLDTICNVFGGIILIAILIAIQVQHTESEIQNKDAPSVEQVSQLEQQLQTLQRQITAAASLFETVRKTMPEPKEQKELDALNYYKELTEQKAKATEKKGELIAKHLAVSQQEIELETQVKNVEAQVKQLESQEQNLSAALKNEQNTNKALGQSTANLQSEIDELGKQIAAKEKKVNDKNNPAKNTRQETLYLPKQHDSGSKLQFGLVVRFNRVYIAADWNVTIGGIKQLGVPDPNAGISLDGSPESEAKIKALLKQHDATTTYLLTIVYADSADSYYQLRDAMVDAGFEYALLPSLDDEVWTFGGTGGARDVQ
ncbi:hypothetical protein FACS189454_00690 [Planctomycetales bacterium]|nr:hypothetical protein FACS189454_00690 [Planctomycetales bacterium]